MMTCLKCGHEFKSNKKSIKTHCNKCGSFDLIETKELFKKDDFSRFKAESSQKIDELISTVKQLITGHNRLNRDIKKLELKIESHKNNSTSSTKEHSMEKSMNATLDNMG